jgi:hypothetical protein
VILGEVGHGGTGSIRQQDGYGLRVAEPAATNWWGFWVFVQVRSERKDSREVDEPL